MGFLNAFFGDNLSEEDRLKEFWRECERNSRKAIDIANSGYSNSLQTLVCKAFSLYCNFYDGFREISPYIPRYLQDHRENGLILAYLLVCVYDMPLPIAKGLLKLINYDNAFISCLKNWHDFHSKEKLKQEYEFQCNLIRANNQIQESEEKERIDTLVEQCKNLSSKDIEAIIQNASDINEKRALNELLVEIKKREENEKDNAKAMVLIKLRNAYNSYTYDDFLRYQHFFTDSFEKEAAQVLLAEKLEEKKQKLSIEIKQKFQSASLEDLIRAEAIVTDPIEKEILSGILNEKKHSNLSEFMHIKYDSLSLKDLVKEASRCDLLPTEKDYLSKLLTQKMK